MPVETRRIGLVESERLIQLAAGGEPITGDSNLSSGAYRAGDLIGGKYRLIRLVGRGGMGVVWEAHSDALDIRVAIKLIHEIATDKDEQHRLLLEAKAAARLVDPAVVRIFDCGEALTGEPYVVMEYLEGQDLAMRLDERGRLQPIEAVRTLLPIARALGAAHNASIVHRDVKPENVFLARTMTGDEQPKLLDFGIAKMDVPWEKRLTKAGSTLGSPNYMSPEQARGEEVDGRSDIWGLCVVLYEAIAGELPFDGANYNAVMHAILAADVASFDDLGIHEPELWNIVARGLVRDKSLRWQTCAELGKALGAWLIERGVMHDVTGVSLHSTQSSHRASYVRTLESVRPRGLEAKPSATARAALAQTARRLLSDGPKWFLPVMAALGLLGIALVGWRLQVAPQRTAISSPSTASIMSVERPISDRPVVPTTVAAPLVAAPEVPTVPTVASLPPAAAPSGRNGALSSPKGTAKKPNAAPSGKSPVPSRSEPFKSPFD